MNWEPFLSSYGIKYITKGPNLGRGWIGLSCPFCHDDPSYHLGVNIKHGYWNCWRNSSHKGHLPHYLIMELIGCSYQQACDIVGTGSKPNFSKRGDFSGKINLDLLSPNRDTQKPSELELLAEFRDIPTSALSRVFAIPYLMSRGNSQEESLSLARQFNLKFSMKGQFSYRIIFPITLFGNLVTWTGRTVIPKQVPRYKTLTTDYKKSREAGVPQAIESIHDCLFDFDNLFENGLGGTLVITEGPFDAVRISQFGRDRRIFGTCIFGIALTSPQIGLLARLAPRFRKVILLADRDAIGKTMTSLPEWLGFQAKALPSHVKDPGELNQDTFGQVFAKD